jgi:hypothetical protein
VCGKLLITSSSVLLFSFEVPWKNIKKQQKEKKRNKKRVKKARDNIEGTLCVFFLFFCVVVLCDYLGV